MARTSPRITLKARCRLVYPFRNKNRGGMPDLWYRLVSPFQNDTERECRISYISSYPTFQNDTEGECRISYLSSYPFYPNNSEEDCWVSEISSFPPYLLCSRLKNRLKTTQSAMHECPRLYDNLSLWCIVFHMFTFTPIFV